MPLVRIDLRRGKSLVYRNAVATAVHDALVAVVGIPPDDRFVVLTEHGPEGLMYDATFLDIQRSEDIVLIQIILRRGRTPEMRQQLYRQMVKNLSEAPGMRPEDVFIVLNENDPVDWSAGNGDAQLLRSLPAQLPAFGR